MNSSKNKLNYKIIWQKKSYPSKALEWNEFSPTFYLVALQNNVLSDTIKLLKSTDELHEYSYDRSLEEK